MAGPADDPANWRKVDPENLLQFMINKQEVLIELRPDIAPKHVEQVKKITRDTNYDKLPFHRVIDDFMAQGGEVYAIYQIYPRYPMLKGEFTWQRDPAKQKVQWFGTTPEGDKLGYLDGFLVQGQPDETAAISDPPRAKTWAVALRRRHLDGADERPQQRRHAVLPDAPAARRPRRARPEIHRLGPRADGPGRDPRHQGRPARQMTARSPRPRRPTS